MGMGKFVGNWVIGTVLCDLILESGLSGVSGVWDSEPMGSRVVRDSESRIVSGEPLCGQNPRRVKESGVVGTIVGNAIAVDRCWDSLWLLR